MTASVPMSLSLDPGLTFGEPSCCAVSDRLVPEPGSPLPDQAACDIRAISISIRSFARYWGAKHVSHAGKRPWGWIRRGYREKPCPFFGLDDSGACSQ